MNKLYKFFGFPYDTTWKDFAEGMVYGTIIALGIISFILGSILPL